MLELFAFILLGVVVGIITGLIPGIHANMVSMLVVSTASELNASIVGFVVSMAVTHTIVDFLPALLLGLPEENTALSVLPAHSLLLQGRGVFALKLSIAGSILGVLLALLFAPILLVFFFRLESALSYLVPTLVLWVFALSVLGEMDIKRRFATLCIILFSALLGFVALMQLNVQNVLLALVGGFFGLPVIIQSLWERPCVVPQTKDTELAFCRVVRAAGLGMVAGTLVSMIPSIGPAQAAYVVRTFIRKLTVNAYLILIGALATVNMLFSFFLLVYFDKVRTGNAAALKMLGSEEMLVFLPIIVAASLIATGMAGMLAMKIGTFMLSKLHNIPYPLLNLIALLMLLGITFLLAGVIGVAIQLVAAAIAYLAILNGVRRANCMAFLAAPTVFIYLY
jgi:putative membrane protein